MFRSFLALGAALGVALFARPAGAAECTDRWEVFSHEPYQQIAFPDTKVRYWRLRFKLGEPDLALRLTGAFPHARYSNLGLYDASTLTSGDSLADFRTIPDPGSLNPFVDGALRNEDLRAFTAWVAPAAARGLVANVVALPERRPSAALREPRLLELWYRVYLPDAGRGDTGGVALPRVEAFRYDAARPPAAWEPLACPEPAASTPPVFAGRTLPQRRDDGRIRFFAPEPVPLYANPDSSYLAARPNFRRGAEVAVIRFRAPGFADTFDGNATFDGKTDVRYWSFCISGVTTVTSGCLADIEVPVDAAGTATIVVGPPSVEDAARAKGFGFLTRGASLAPLFIYRNVLPRADFAGSFARVPRWTPDRPEPTERFDAEAFIGDHAPRGMHCDVASFLQDACLR